MKLDILGTKILYKDYKDGNPPALPGMPNSLEDSTFKKRILCEGDSWFSIGAVPSENLLSFLMFAESTILCNLAQSGDTIKHMSTISANPDLAHLIAEPRFSVKWDAIFLSGGGNDLIDRAKDILCSPSAGAGNHLLDYVNQLQLTQFKLDIKAGFKKIAQLRDGSQNADTPIVTHLYDYPTPRNAKAKFLGLPAKGPWLYAAMQCHKIPKEHWISLTDYIFEALGAALLELPSEIKNFHVIKTAGTLIPAEPDSVGDDGDWLNEIHPNTAGYKKLSKVVSPELFEVLY